MPLNTVDYFDAHWYGPYDDVRHQELADTGLVLYMVCGTHGLYGKQVPLYIGKTLQSVPVRMAQHQWMKHEPDPVKVYAAAISPAFQDWSEVQALERYPPPVDAVVTAVESLLIYAHQPVYNTRSKGGGQGQGALRHLHVFNTGRRSILYPEVSSMYWYD